MPLQPSDEFAHPRVEVPNWQENYVWHAWNPETRCGWNLHLGNISEEGVVDVRAHVIVNGVLTAGSLQQAGDNCFGASGLDVEVIESFGRMKIRFGGTGSTGPDAVGWFGRAPGDVRFGFEVDILTPHVPFDSNSHPELEGLMDLPGTGNHYELGGSWSGRLWAGDTSVDASGLVVRDHSWGGRVWNWDELFWVPMVFDGGRRFVFNLAERFGEEWMTLSVAMDESGQEAKRPEMWVRLDGERRPFRFGWADVLMAGDGTAEKRRLRGDIHIPIGRARSRVGLSDMWSTIVEGDRPVGFSTVQTFPTEAEVAYGFENPLSQFAH